MATILKVAGADFSANALGFIPPIASGLEAWFFQGTGKSTKNRAEGKADATVTGAPTYAANTASFKGGISGQSELVTSVVDSAALTLFAIVSTDDDGAAGTTQPVWIGCISGTTGVGLFVRSAGKDGFQWYTSAAATDFLTPAAAVASLAPYRFIAATTDGVNFALYDKTNNVVTSKTTATGRSLAAAGNPFKIGNYYASTRSGTGKHVMDGIYSRALSAAEIETLYQYAKAYCARRGITI